MTATWIFDFFFVCILLKSLKCHLDFGVCNVFHELHNDTERKGAALPDADFVNEVLDLITANKE